MKNGYKHKFTFASDFGTGDYKYGSIVCGEVPEITQNRGYFPDDGSLVHQVTGARNGVIVGKDIPFYMEDRDDLSSRLIYPMKNGVIDRNDEKAWAVVNEVTKLGLTSFRPQDPEFEGFYVVASLSAAAPKYMYERLFDIHKKIDEEERMAKAVTIIPQPLAVAIAHKAPTCVVLESGHGNTQVCPISRYPVRKAIVTINRGGGDANAITAEILKDSGFGDLAHEESFVRKVKENLGLVPIDLDAAVKLAKEQPERFRGHFKAPGTRVSVDLAENSWTRFLIGEYVFNPNHEIFLSYFRRGMPKPSDVRFGDTVFKGMLDIGDAIIEAVERCPIELQPHLYRQVLLSGGNFAWKVPEQLRDVATDSSTKIKLLLAEKGISEVNVRMTESPQYSVWRGCIVYGYAAPAEYSWNWNRLEGWYHIR